MTVECELVVDDFLIFGIDVEKGFYSMTEVPSSPSFIIPSKFKTQLQSVSGLSTRTGNEKEQRIDGFYTSNLCFFCRKVSSGDEIVCSNCRKHPQDLLIRIAMWIQDVEQRIEVYMVNC